MSIGTTASSVDVLGTEEIIKNIEEKLGASRTNRLVNKALRETAKEVESTLKDNVYSWRDTGATYDEIVTSGIKTSGGIKRIEVGWTSKGSRWRIVHLNEFGYTRYGKFQKPRGMGSIQKTVDQTKNIFPKRMKEELAELGK